MLNFFRRRKPRVEWRVKSRSENSRGFRPEHVDISRVAPEPETLVGFYAYLHLTESNALGKYLSDIRPPLMRARVSEVASIIYEDVQSLAKSFDFIQSDEFEGARIRQAEIDQLQLRLRAGDWHEALLKSHLMLGMLDDFGLELAESLSPLGRAALGGMLRERRETSLIQDVLLEEMERVPQLRGELALWGRRLVGDTLLTARNLLALEGSTVLALRHPSEPRSVEDTELIGHIEAGFAAIIAEHTRRMDALGLTA